MLSDESQHTRFRSMHDSVLGTLRDWILSGVLKPGTRLRVADLADDLGISAMPVREALRRLQATGLVVTIPHRGTWVASLSSTEVEALYDVRMILEQEAARRGAEGTDAKRRQLLRGRLGDLKAATTSGDVSSLLACDEAFLSAVYEGGNTSTLTERLERHIGRSKRLQAAIAETELGAVLISSPESIYYFTGFWGYVSDSAPENFGRPTLLFVPSSGDCILITPRMEQEYAGKSSWVRDIRTWVDGEAGEFGSHLDDLLPGLNGKALGIEQDAISARVLRRLRHSAATPPIEDASSIIIGMRMIKDPLELEMMRAGGRVAVAMGDAAVAAIEDGVTEYEIALAAMAGGTRASAALFDVAPSEDLYASPIISNLMIISSGPDITMPHKRPTMRRIRKGDSVYLCFCTTASFKGYRITYDRQVILAAEPTPSQLRLHDRVLTAQAAALTSLQPGITAQEVHRRARKVVEESGYRIDYRSGRGIGLGFLEPPQFKDGDDTVLEPGMTFAVDGGAVEPGVYASRVGDSVILTEDGYELLTDSPRELVRVGA